MSDPTSTQRDLRDLFPVSWKETADTIWIVGYRMMLVAAAEIQGFAPVELGDVVGVLLWGSITLPTVHQDLRVGQDGSTEMTFNVGEPVPTVPGPTLLLMTPTRSDEAPSDEARTRATLQRTVGLIVATLGENAAYEKMFDVLCKVETGELTSFGPTIVNPSWLGPPPTTKQARREATLAATALARLPEALRQRTELSLRWFEQAHRTYGVEAFLWYWLALETLAMPDTTNIQPLNEGLGRVYRINGAQVKTLFMVRRLYGLRGRIVHRGEILSIHWQMLQFMGALYVDLLRDVLTLPAVNAAKAVLIAEPSEKWML